MLAENKEIPAFDVTEDYWQLLLRQQTEAHLLLGLTQARYRDAPTPKTIHSGVAYGKNEITQVAGAWHCSAQGGREYQEDCTHSFQMPSSMALDGDLMLVVIDRFFEKMNFFLRELPGSGKQGACCAIAVTLDDEIIVGSLGDCQVEVLTRSKTNQSLSCMLLTPQHQVELEAERIQNAGLNIFWNGAARVEQWGGIMLSGAMGDFDNGDDVFRRKPSLVVLPLDDDDEKILLGLGSDGVLAESIIRPEDFAEIYHRFLKQLPQVNLSLEVTKEMPELLKLIDKKANRRQQRSDNRSTILRYIDTVSDASRTYSVDVVIDGHSGFVVAQAIKKNCQRVFEAACQEVFAQSEKIQTLAINEPALFLNRASLGLMKVIEPEVPEQQQTSCTSKSTSDSLAHAQDASPPNKWQQHASQLIAYRTQRYGRWFGGNSDPNDERNQAVTRLFVLLDNFAPDLTAINQQVESMKHFDSYGILYYLTCCLTILFWNYTLHLQDILSDIRLDLETSNSEFSMEPH